MAASSLVHHRCCALPSPRPAHPLLQAACPSSSVCGHRHAVRTAAVLAPPAGDRASPSITSGRPRFIAGLTAEPAPREELQGADFGAEQQQQQQQQDAPAPAPVPSEASMGHLADGDSSETPLAPRPSNTASRSRWPAPKPGDEVVGTVVFTNSKGCMVRLRGGQFVGHVPASQGPMLLPASEHAAQHRRQHVQQEPQQQQQQQAQQEPAAAEGSPAEAAPGTHTVGPPPRAHKALVSKERYQGVLPLGMSRRFVVMSMPTDGRGPLLSAALADQRVIMARAHQLKEMQLQPLKARVASVSAAGCHCEVPGLCGPHAFLPWRLVPQDGGHRTPAPPPGGTSAPTHHVAQQQQQQQQQQQPPPSAAPSRQGPQQQQPAHPLCVGDEVDVLVHQVDEAGAKIVLTALDMQPSVLQPGHLVTGHVQEVHAWGVSVVLRGVHEHPEASAQLQGHEALLHHQRITRLHAKPAPQDVFQPGDQVTARVVYVARCADHRGAAAAWRAGGLTGSRPAREGERDQHPYHTWHHHLDLPRRLQVELSLMELEMQDGDMLDPEARQACFAAALA